MPVKYPLARRKVNRFETAARAGRGGSSDRRVEIVRQGDARFSFRRGNFGNKERRSGRAGERPPPVCRRGRNGANRRFYGNRRAENRNAVRRARISGKGFRKKPVNFAFDVCAVDEVTVNEQNPRARGFYERMGFRAVSRSAVDGQGNPYPVLRMRVQKNRENEI